MAIIGKWGGLIFGINSSKARGFADLQIKASSETEEKEAGNQKYISRKNGKPAEISMTVHSDARLGCNVRNDAETFIKGAQNGKTDYFYVSNKKLVPCQLMLTDATVKSVELSPKGKWISADIQLTMKQCDKGDGTGGASSGTGSGSGSSGGTSNRASVKNTSTTTTKKSILPPAAVSGAATAVTVGIKTTTNALTKTKTTKSAVATAVTTAQSAIKKIVSTAKTYTASKKTTTKKATTTTKKIAGAAKKIKR